jgi:hypothetical protein
MAGTDIETDSIAPAGGDVELRPTGRLLSFLGRHQLPFLTLLC